MMYFHKKITYYCCCFYKTKETNNEKQEDTYNAINENTLTEKLCRTTTSVGNSDERYSLSNDMTIAFNDIYG